MTSDKTYHEVGQDLAREWAQFWNEVNKEPPLLRYLLYCCWGLLLWPVTWHLPKIDQEGGAE